MKTYLYLSDIHSNFEALKHLDSLPEMQNPDCEIRFGGDYIDGERQREHVIKFFDVWSEVYGMFWW